MGESSFTIQFSHNFVSQLALENDLLKKRTRKAKPKVPRETKTPRQSHSKQKQVSNDSEILKGPSAAGWPVQPPLYLPPPHAQPATADLDAIRSAVKEAEAVLERVKKQEADKAQEVTERAKDLHAKEFKLPEQKSVPCLDKYEACRKCYMENLGHSLRCRFQANEYADCVRKFRQLAGSQDK